MAGKKEAAEKQEASEPETNAGTEGKRVRRKPKSNFSIPTSLDMVANQHEEEMKDAPEEEEEVVFDYDPTVQIDKPKFEQALKELEDHVGKEGMHNLRSTLKSEQHKLDGNKWIQTVHNQLMKNILLGEPWIVAEMRVKTGVSNLILEVVVNEQDLHKNDKLPYTNEEKLKLMEERNPNLKSFMQRFDTMMKY